MKRTLRGSKQPSIDEAKAAAKNVQPELVQDVESAVRRYEGKSEAELIGELKSAQQSGLIDPNELSGVAARIAPMLSAEQRQRLESVLKNLQ